MLLSDTAVKNRVSVLILAAIILIFGTYCYQVLPRESDPDVSIPYVFISTPYKGVAAPDMETTITIPIEKKIKGVEGIKKVKSVSAEGLSQINIEFITGIDIDDAIQDVKDKVDEALADLPADLENDPAVFEVNLSELPIVIYSLSGPAGITRLKEIADDLEDAIESIPGVLEVDVTGGVEREIMIEVDPDKLAYYRIPITTFQQVVSSENLDTSGGSITLGHGRYQLRIPGEFTEADEIYNLVVATHKGSPVYLKDLAQVIDGFKEEDSRSRLNGEPAINIAVKKRTGENIIAISDQVEALIQSQKPYWPPGTQVTKLMDQAKDIRSMVSDLENNILSGLILVIVVLLFALGIRNAVLVAMAIPFSMLLSFILLHLLGITLNMVVLFSLTLALGMLVDNAIVIIENIYRFMEQGMSRIDAAKGATAEVAWPVIGSTLTTLAAFVPLLFWPGVTGEFMSYLPITLIITLSSSLVVALVINPALAAFFMRLKGGAVSGSLPESGAINTVVVKPVKARDRLVNAYTALLRTALRFRITVLCLSAGLVIVLILIWLLVVGLEKPNEFLPPVDPTYVYVNIKPPEGADLSYIDSIVKQVEMAVADARCAELTRDGILSREDYERVLAPIPHEREDGSPYTGPSDLANIKYIYAKSIENPVGALFGTHTPTHVGIEFIDLKDRKRPSTDTLLDIRQRLKYIPGARITVEQQEEGPPTGPPINIEISGDKHRVLGELAKTVRGLLAQIPTIKDIQDDYINAIPSIQITIDRQKAALFGLTSGSIGFALKTAYNGAEISSFQEGDDDYDIIVRLGEADRRVTDVLHKLMLPTPEGQLIPLTSIAQVAFTGSIGDIVRVDYKRTVTVRANVDETITTGAVARKAAEQLLAEKLSLPTDYTATFTGEFKDQQESQAFLSRAFVIAVLFIFLILVTLFNSVAQPLIILTSVVLSLGGVFLGLTVLKSPFGIIMSGVGVISLAGVVVNNAIVLIDYINRLREAGLNLQAAVISAGITRLRPVLLTAITTVLGLVPMVTGISYDFRSGAWSLVSESSQWWRSMAIVVIFGLIIATFLTLVVVPVLYALLVSTSESMHRTWVAVKRWYWSPFEAGQDPE
ncbi:MAG: acriflavin resistance protein [Deltaproteobacteria bacterium]|nr:MAG: acriflavin resistance protein [Deltaproteobacteria bacterium]